MIVRKQIIISLGLVLLSLTLIYLFTQYTKKCGTTSSIVAATDTPLQKEDNSEPLRKNPLSSEQQQTIDNYGFIIGNQQFLQIFEPYTDPTEPVFITSDTVINAYNILFEDSYCELEKINAERLPMVLRYLVENLEYTNRMPHKSQKLIPAAKKRAKIVLGTALLLVGETSFQPDTEIKNIIKQEAELVRRAEGFKAPGWIKTDSNFLGIDYSIFKPVGFYAENKKLADYYRAVKWLQTIPFRMEDDVEATSIFVLGDCIFNNKIPEKKMSSRYKKVQAMITDFFRLNREFLCEPDNLDMYYAGTISSGTIMPDDSFDSLDSIRETKKMKETKTEINDLAALKPSKGVEVKNFRIIAPSRLPDSVLFHRVINNPEIANSSPSGCMIAAVMGSESAESIVSKNFGENSDRIMAVLNETKPFFRKKSYYGNYLSCLSKLFNKPEPDAPYFMQNEKWRLKELQTFLCGWSLMRHTFVLSTKVNTMYAGFSEIPPGFVEPVPEFYSEFAEFTRKTRLLLKQSGAFSTEFIRNGLADRLREYAKIRRSGTSEIFNEENGISKEEVLFAELLPLLYKKFGDVFKTPPSPAEIEKLATAIEKTEYFSEELEPLFNNTVTLESEKSWEELEYLCRKLESLSYKQLRKKEFNQDEIDFIKEYGPTLAGIMLYGGNSYLCPMDDAPRTVSVSINPNSGKNKFMQVATGRPHVIYVLYPYKDKKVLCKGAVMSYYEFPSDIPLTDEQWRKTIKANKAARQPEWIMEITR